MRKIEVSIGISTIINTRHGGLKLWFSQDWKCAKSLFTVVPALGDMVVAFPAVVSQSQFGLTVAAWRSHLPLAAMGLSWLVPALVGAVVGLLFHWFRRQRVSSPQTDLN